jgi:hypothetical protein
MLLLSPTGLREDDSSFLEVGGQEGYPLTAPLGLIGFVCVTPRCPVCLFLTPLLLCRTTRRFPVLGT